MPASIARRLLTDISARSIAADLYFSSLAIWAVHLVAISTILDIVSAIT
jgi:hypothetical protein